MKLDGIHHVTCTTADAVANLAFYTGVLGLRLVKKSINQDDPTAYHLFFSDEHGSPGADITFFEYPGARRGRPGAGMVHTIVSRVAGEDALDFWAERLTSHGVDPQRIGEALAFADPEGLRHELVISDVPDPPLVAEHPEIPRDVALQGIDGVKVYGADPVPGRELFEDTLGFVPLGDTAFSIRGDTRGARYVIEPPPPEAGVPGAGTVHHVAWSSTVEDHPAWRERIDASGQRVTPVIDRFYFKALYFREPGGVLFEIATQGPGFDVDEPAESLGEHLSLPPSFEHLRPEVEPALTPLPNPRQAADQSAA